jgi:hypothetical protein
MYSQKWNSVTSFPVRSYIHVLAAIYIFPGTVCLCDCSKIGRPILGNYKSLTNTWMWKLGDRTLWFIMDITNNEAVRTVSFLGIHKSEPNIYIGFSVAHSLHLQCIRNHISTNNVSYIGQIIQHNVRIELVIRLNVRTADHFYISLLLFTSSLIKNWNWLIFLICTEICKESGTKSCIWKRTFLTWEYGPFLRYDSPPIRPK